MANKFTEAELESLLSRTPEFADRHFSMSVTRKTTSRISRNTVFLVALLGWTGFALLFGDSEVLVRLANGLVHLTSNLVLLDVTNLSARFAGNYTSGITALCIVGGLLALLINKLRAW